MMHIIYKHLKPFEEEQKRFIENSLKNSFPNLQFSCKKNIVFSNKKDSSKQLKQSCKKIIEILLKSNIKKILFYQQKKKFYSKNPLIFLKNSKQVTQISNGLFQFQGDFLKVFRATNTYFYELAIKKFKAIDQENPVLWPIDLYKKIDYFSDFPQQILMISGLKKNYQAYNRFSKKYKKSNNFKNIKIDKNFRNSEYGLQPAVCDNCYYALKNSKFLNNKIFTTYNKVFRDEVSKYNTLDRLISFSVRDIMFVGDKNFTLGIRNNLIESIKKFLNISELNCSIEVANDPFFVSNIDKKVFQDAFDLKFEILADIPFLKEKIAIGSINYHFNTFGKALGILKKGKPVFSGCIGIGFERVLLALYSQFGTDLKHWPRKFKKLIKLT